MSEIETKRILGRMWHSLLVVASVTFVTLLISYNAVAAEDDVAMDYKQYAVGLHDKPFALDCLRQHSKYLPSSSKTQTELASISGSHDDHSGHGQASNRGSYSSKYVAYKVPIVDLVTDTGVTVKLADILNAEQPVILNFIFTTCTTICPVLSASFKQVQKLLGEEAEEVLLISISIDPEYDTPDKLAEYAERFSAGADWRFLTGQIDDIIAVEKAFDIYRGSKTNHDPVTFLRAGNADTWLRLEGFAEAAEIIAEFRKLTSSDG